MLKARKIRAFLVNLCERQMQELRLSRQAWKLSG